MRSSSACPAAPAYANRLSSIDWSSLLYTDEGEMTITNLDVAMT